MFFFGKAVVFEGADLRHDVESNRSRMNGRFRGSFSVERRARFVEQGIDSLLASAAARLVCCHAYRAQACDIGNRLERQHELNRRTIRVGNDARLGLDFASIDLGHDERPLWGAPKRRRVVDHQRTRRHNPIGQFEAHRLARTTENDIDAAKIERMRIAHRARPQKRLDDFARTPRRREQRKRRHRQP